MPTRTTAALTAKIGAGQRTTAVPTRPPQPAAGLALLLEQPEAAAQEDDRRAQCQAGHHHDEHADRHRCAHGVEPGQPREAQAVRRAGDRQARTQHHGGDSMKCRVVGGLPILAGPACLLITADEEDPVVGSGGDRQHRQDVRGERGEPERVVVGQHRDDSARTGQRDKGHEQLDQRGDDRAVDQQQHDRDRTQGEQRDLGQAGVADDVHVVGERRGTGDVGLHPGRRGFSSTTLRTASTDLLACVVPWLPAMLT